MLNKVANQNTNDLMKLYALHEMYDNMLAKTKHNHAEEKKDAIKPNYYNQYRYPPIEVIQDWKLGFCLGNALKYIARAGKKDPKKEIEDLQKAITYLNFRIEELKKEGDHDEETQ